MAHTAITSDNRGMKFDNLFTKIMVDIEFAFLGLALFVTILVGYSLVATGHMNFVLSIPADFRTGFFAYLSAHLDTLDTALKNNLPFDVKVLGGAMVLVWAIAGPFYAARARAGIMTGIIRFLMTAFFILGPLVILVFAAISIVGTFGLLFIAAWKEFLLAALITGLPFSILFNR